MATKIQEYLSFGRAILTNHKVLSVLFIVTQTICIIGVFTISFSQRWLVQRCDESRFRNCEANLGIFDSCVLYLDYSQQEGEKFECKQCKSSPRDDEAYTKKTDVSSLTTAKTFAGK